MEFANYKIWGFVTMVERFFLFHFEIRIFLLIVTLLIYLYILKYYCNIVDLQCCVSFRYTAEWISFIYIYSGFFPNSVGKNLPAMQETRVRFLGGEDPLEKEIATHSNILAWEIPWTGKPSRLYPMKSDMTERPTLSCFYSSCMLHS